MENENLRGLSKIPRNINTTRVSSKGQIVIPKDMRDELHLTTGSTLEIIEIDNLIVLKQLKESISKEDLSILKDAIEGMNEIREGKYVKYNSKKEFLKDLEKW